MGYDLAELFKERERDGVHANYGTVAIDINEIDKVITIFGDGKKLLVLHPTKGVMVRRQRAVKSWDYITWGALFLTVGATLGFGIWYLQHGGW